MNKADKNRHSSTLEIRLSLQKALKANLSEQARTGLLERRSGKDRRGWGNMPPVPFQDSLGTMVYRDRRVLAERRVSSVQVDWDVQNNRSASLSVPVNHEPDPVLPEDIEHGIAPSSSTLQSELDALAENIDDMVDSVASDLMDDSELDYNKPSDEQ